MDLQQILKEKKWYHLSPDEGQHLQTSKQKNWHHHRPAEGRRQPKSATKMTSAKTQNKGRHWSRELTSASVLGLQAMYATIIHQLHSFHLHRRFPFCSFNLFPQDFLWQLLWIHQWNAWIVAASCHVRTLFYRVLLFHLFPQHTNEHLARHDPLLGHLLLCYHLPESSHQHLFQHRHRALRNAKTKKGIHDIIVFLFNMVSFAMGVSLHFSIVIFFAHRHGPHECPRHWQHELKIKHQLQF